MDIDQEDASVSGIENIFSTLNLNSLIIDSELLRDAINKICSENKNEEQIGVISIRKFLSVEAQPPIQEVINTGILPILIKMSYTRSIEFAFEVCWILCNIGSGSTQHVRYLIKLETLDYFYDIFECNQNTYDIKKQIVWAVGNLAGDNEEIRDLVNNSKVFEKILDFAWEVLKLKKFSIVETCIWALSNCVRGKPTQDKKIYDQVYSFFLEALLLDIENSDIIWSLSYISEFSAVSNIFENTHLIKVLSFLESTNAAIVIPSLRIIGNLSARVAESCKLLLPLGVIDKILSLIGHEKKTVRRELYWTLSNMCYENNDIVCILLSNSCYQYIFDQFDHQENEVAGEIVWVIANSLHSADQCNVKELFKMGWCHKFLELMKGQKVNKHKEAIVEGLIKIFNKSPTLLTSELKQEILKLHNYSDENINLIEKIEDLKRDINLCEIYC